MAYRHTTVFMSIVFLDITFLIVTNRFEKYLILFFFFETRMVTCAKDVSFSPNFNRYLAETFNFNLCPVSLGTCDPRFSLQVTTFEYSFVCLSKCIKDQII